MFDIHCAAARRFVRAASFTLGAIAAASAAHAASSSFGLAVLPDTQFYSRYSVEGNQFMLRYGSEPYASQTAWLAQHARSLNIPFVVHLGDVVDRPGNSGEWGVADRAMKTLEDAELPYSILAGNHDVTVGCGYVGRQDDCTDAQRNPANELYLRTFPSTRAATQATFGGRDPSGFHEYHIFEAEGQRFMSLAMSWRASDAAIAWARNVIASHPTVPVILTTHDYLAIDSDGVTARDTPYGDFLWDRLVKDNDQIFMVLNGHNHGSAHKHRVNNFGNRVFEAVSDYQMAYQGGNGYMRIYEFDLSENKIRSLTFSPWVPMKPKATLNAFDRAVLDEPNNEFEIAIDFKQRFAGFAPSFGPGSPTRDEPIVETVRAMILDGYEEPTPPATALPYDSEDYPSHPDTVAHWRFHRGTPGQPVAANAQVRDETGANPLRRGLAAGAPLEGAVWSAERHARTAANGSVCFTSPTNPNAHYFATLAGVPINNDYLMTGYTVEAVMKIDRDWSAANNAWMSVMTRGGKRLSVPGWSGSYGDSSTMQFAISNLREVQWEITTIPSPGRLQSKTNWSGEIMADQWEHVAFVNDPVTHDTTMYVAGAPVLRNVTNAIGIAGVPDQPWVVGGSINGSAGSGFFGCISEIRVTRAALTPEQWLTARKHRVEPTGSRVVVQGTDADDQIFSTAGANRVTGGAGKDTFVYRSLREAGDTIADFSPANDHLNLQPLLASVGYRGSNPLTDGVVRVIDSPNGAVVQIDADGSQGPAVARPFVTLTGVSAQELGAEQFLF